MGFLSSIGDAIGGIAGVAFGVLFKPVSKLLKEFLAPNLPDKQGLKIQRKGSNLAIKVVYGTRVVGGDIVDENVTDASGGAKNEFFHRLVVFCHGEVDAVEEVFFNGVSWNDARWKKEGGGKWFTYEVRKGGADNLTPVDAAGKLEKFDSANSLYEGLCFIFFTFQMDKEQTVWRGEPEITARIRGKRCYDWRTGLTQYTENPAVHMIDYLKSPLYGKALADSDINYPYFTAVADACDTTEGNNTVTETVTEYVRETGQIIEYTNTTTENFKRFTNNAIIDTERTIFENMKEIALAFRGFFPEPDGRIAIASEDVARSVFSFNRDNMLSSVERTTPSRNERYNRVVVRFPNNKNKDKLDEVYYPPADSQIYQDWLDADNGVPQENTITAEWCIYKAEALQLAEVAAKASRNGEQVRFTATPEATELDIGDVVDITDETRGWSGREYRVSQLELREDGNVNVSAILHNNTIYPWAGKTYDERVGGTFLGDPSNIAAPSNLLFFSDPNNNNSGRLTWNHVSDSFVRRYKVTITNSGGVEVVTGMPTNKEFVIPTLSPGDYEIDVYAVSTLGIYSPSAALVINLTAPVAPNDIIFAVTDWTIEAQPTIPGGVSGTGTTFEFDWVFGDGAGYTPTPRADGSSLQATGLLPDTTYTFFVRAINAYGVSGWYSESATTTNTGEQISAVLDPIRDELDQYTPMTVPQLPDIATAFSGVYEDYKNNAELNNERKKTEIIAGKVDDPQNNGSALFSFVQQAEAKADGSLTAVNTLQSRVDANEDFASSQLVLNAEYDSELDTLSARAFLGTNVNDRVTGIVIGDSGSEQSIDFLSDSVRFFNNAGQAKIYFDVANDRYVFDGEIIANAGTFTGTVSGGTINGSTVNGIEGTFNNLTTDPDGYIRTAPSSADGVRVIMNGPDTGGSYAIWAGEGVQNDSNATFFIKKNGTGFIKGDFFQGEIIESKGAAQKFTGASPWSVTASNHISAGKTVKVDVDISFSAFADGNRVDDDFYLNVTVKRGSTTIGNKRFYSFRPFYEAPNDRTMVVISGSSFVLDPSESKGSRNYTVEVELIGSASFSSIDASLSLLTNENKLSS